ncbi:MAG: hypothetical protein AB7H93_03850 [Vicinamibacterales bacterium]
MGASSIGIPELMVVVALGMFWMVPFAAAVWAAVTLHRLRSSQQVLHERLERIETLLRQPSVS